MSKKIWIIISIFAFLIGLMLILFGAVFCVRNQKVEFIGDRARTLSLTNEQILTTAGIQNGDATFFVDKAKATDKIEHAYPYLKVVHIETTSPITINFKLRERVAMYYAKFNEKYIIVDEELKVLEIANHEPSLTILNMSALGITTKTKAGDFIGEDFAVITDNLFTAMYNVAKINGEYLDRAGITAFMTEISIDTGYTLTMNYQRLIIKTNLGVTLDIAQPDENLEYKLNTLMSTLDSDQLTPEQKSSGTLKYYLTQDNEPKAGYFEAGN